MLFGVEKNQSVSPQIPEQPEHKETSESPTSNQNRDVKDQVEERGEDKINITETNELEGEREDVGAIEHIKDISDDHYLTHKVASFLEKGVVKFYDFIVEVMYGFSSVFF